MAPIEVGAAFGDGLLAAEADLSAMLRGDATMPTGLLAGLPWAACARGGDPTARPLLEPGSKVPTGEPGVGR